MTVRFAMAAVVLLAAGCDSNGAGGDNSATQTSARIDKCAERFLQRAKGEPTEEAERYVKVTYCRPFTQGGWVYDDGTLSIDAYLHLEAGGSCATGKSGEPTRTVPCEDIEQGFGPRVLDCAPLHLVRRDEVRKYVEDLQRRREVSCDDGTPLTELGAR